MKKTLTAPAPARMLEQNRTEQNRTEQVELCPFVLPTASFIRNTQTLSSMEKPCLEGAFLFVFLPRRRVRHK